MDKIVVVGGGFGGFWSAVGARRQYALANAAAQITVIDSDGFLTMRPRLYEAFGPHLRVPLPPPVAAPGHRSRDFFRHCC